jgi:hypothetical protein
VRPFLVAIQIKEESSWTMPETKDWGRPSLVERTRMDWGYAFMLAVKRVASSHHRRGVRSIGKARLHIKGF